VTDLFLPHISVYLNTVRAEQRLELSLEIKLLVMFLLIADVIANRTHLRFANRKRTIPTLPRELAKAVRLCPR
jgi:hypothetical protein